jgi:hypothetical protein
MVASGLSEGLVWTLENKPEVLGEETSWTGGLGGPRKINWKYSGMKSDFIDE